MEELDLTQIFNTFWNKKFRILIIIVIFEIIGFAYTMKLVTPQYSSSITLVLTSSNNTITQTDININSKLISTYCNLIKSQNVLKTVKANLNIDMSETLLENSINVRSISGTELIEITATTENPNDASKIANEVANVFINKVTELYNINNIQVVNEASIPQSPTNINHKKDIALFTFIGIVVSILYIFIITMFDTTIKTIEEIEKEFKLPVLATIPIYDINEPKTPKGDANNEN